MQEQYLTEIEFCERYRAKPRTAQRWRQIGYGGPKFCRLGMRRIGYRLSDCEEWAKTRTFTSIAAEMAQNAAA